VTDEQNAAAAEHTLGLDPQLLAILACPCPAHASLSVDVERQLLVCAECGRGFLVRDRIPIMLLDESIPAAS